MDLFCAAFPQAKWDRLKELDHTTAAGRAFRKLLPGERIPAIVLAAPDVAGLDYRRRLSDLRDMGVIIEVSDIDGRPYKAYRINPTWLMAFGEKSIRRSA